MGVRGKRIGGSAWLAASLALVMTSLPLLELSAQENDDGDAAFRAEARATQPFNKMVQTLVVTARKAEERQQQVPVALTTLTTEEIDQANVRRLNEIQNLVPNLQLDNGQGQANSARITLRGLTETQDVSTNDPVVGVYVDGVYRPRLQGSLLALYDIERVEVLRGPQGALFGKNTIGGAINITTRQPEFEFGGQAELRVGNFDTLESRFSLNLPLVPEKAAARISLSTATRDGYIKNTLNGDEYQDNKSLGGRFQLTLLPREDVEVNLAFEANRDNRKGFGAKCKLAGEGFDFGNLFVNGVLPDGSGLPFREQCANEDRTDELKVANDLSGTKDDLSSQGYSARVTWDVTPDLTITSISSFRNQDIETLFDADSSPSNIIQFQNDGGGDNQRALSQEFQLTGITGSGRLRYVAGVFYLSEDISERSYFGLGFEPVTDEMGEFLFADDGRLMLQEASTLNVDRLKVRNRSLAAYGQGTYSLTERLDLTVGARLTKDFKRVRSDQRVAACRSGPVGDPCRLGGLLGQGNQGPGSFDGFERSGRFDDISPSVSLAYAFNPEVLVYASYNEGFQSGGFNGSAASEDETDDLENEELVAYELGLKSTWLGGRVVFNAAGFYNILTEGTRVPLFTLENGQLAESSVLDVGATVLGGEVEVGLLPMQGLQLRASLGAQKGELDDFQAGRANGLSEARLPAVPNVTMNFTVDYERELFNFGTLGLRTSWTHRGKQNPDIQGRRELDVGKYGLLDGRVSLELPDGQTEIAAYGTNLLDRRYFIGGFTAADFGFVNRFFGPPRFYGVEVRRRF